MSRTRKITRLVIPQQTKAAITLVVCTLSIPDSQLETKLYIIILVEHLNPFTEVGVLGL